MPRPSSAINAAERAATNMKQIVGENIKARRIALDLSQEELAEKFGISRTALSQFEIGVGEVNAGDLPRLASILGISTLQFFERPASDYFSASDRTGVLRLDGLNRYGTQQTGNSSPVNPGPANGSQSAPLMLHGIESIPRSQGLSELMSQISQLSAEDQETVRRMVGALHNAQSVSASKSAPSGPKAPAKRVSRRRT